MFDQGLWSLDDNYRIIVSHGSFDEEAHNQKSIRDFHGLKLLCHPTQICGPIPSILPGTASTSSVHRSAYMRKPTGTLGRFIDAQAC